MSGCQAPGEPIALRVREMTGHKKAGLWANGATVMWRGQVDMRQAWGQMAIRGNCLALPFSNLKGADRWGQKVEPERSGRYSGQGDPQAGRRPRTAGLRGGAGEARPWETSEEGRSLRGSTRRGVATLGKGGFPFLQKGENTSAGEGMTPGAGPGRELKWRG